MNTPDERTDAPSDKSFEQRARQLYLEAARQLDPTTAGRLRAARREALASARAPAKGPVRLLIPAGAFAVIALAALLIRQPLPHMDAPASGHAAVVNDASGDVDNELPPDAEQTDPNLYQDLDFYDWLAANDNRTSRH